MTKISLFIAGIMLLCACGNKLKPNEYVLQGTVTGYPDSTYIYFQAGSHQDSALIIKNKFVVSGTLKNNEPEELLLHVKGTRDYQNIWLENAAMTFTAEKGKFKDAVTSGSKTQLLHDEINAAMTKINTQGDSLNKLVAGLKLTQKEAEPKFRSLQDNMDTCVVRFIENIPTLLLLPAIYQAMHLPLGIKQPSVYMAC